MQCECCLQTRTAAHIQAVKRAGACMFAGGSATRARQDKGHAISVYDMAEQGMLLVCGLCGHYFAGNPVRCKLFDACPKVLGPRGKRSLALLDRLMHPGGAPVAVRHIGGPVLRTVVVSRHGRGPQCAVLG